jgi:alkaline phosphatase D
MAHQDYRRRRFLRDAGLLVGTAAAGVFRRAHAQDLGATADLRAFAENPPTRIAFGSCAHQDKEQPIWEAVLAANPDLFVFLGDNVYGDTRDMGELRAKYAKLAVKPGFRKLRAAVPVLATWDDHDYGENDAGAEYPMREESRRLFLEFWQEPVGSPRWSRDGVYTSYVLGPPGRRVQIILPDLRYNRTPITALDLSGTSYEEWSEAKQAARLPVPGPYARSPDGTATMLGERQWRWLEAQLEVPADVRVIASSLQVLADFPGWEAWINYARDHQRLLDLIRRKGASGVVFISGDTHYAELTRLEVNVPYVLWDLTSSGLTEVWPVDVPNANRVGSILREPNFGMVELEWHGRLRYPRIRLQAFDARGAVRIVQEIDGADLRG